MPYVNEDQRKMAKAWRSKAWEKRRDELLAAHPRCEWCNGTSAQINHKRKGWYPEYQLMLRHEVDVICMPCHLYFTETGKRRPRMYANCSECDAPIWPSRKECFRCGSRVLQMSEQDPEKRLRLIKIMDRCPEVRIGDTWNDVWCWPGEVVVTKFEKQDTLPWPMVKTDRGEVGLPAFMFGVLGKRGKGVSWTKTL